MLHSDLLARVWGPEYHDEVDYLWTYVRYLRNKIEPDPGNPRYIISEPGVGYMLAAE
jgi:two-component system KDP operon response regulator KdpE